MVKAPFREARRLSADVDRMCAIALLLPHNRRFSTRPCALPPDLRVSDIPVGPCICFFVRSAFVLFTSSRPWFNLYTPWSLDSTWALVMWFIEPPLSTFCVTAIAYPLRPLPRPPSRQNRLDSCPATSPLVPSGV